jgi:hypothetical protein
MVGVKNRMVGVDKGRNPSQWREKGPGKEPHCPYRGKRQRESIVITIPCFSPIAPERQSINFSPFGWRERFLRPEQCHYAPTKKLDWKGPGDTRT